MQGSPRRVFLGRDRSPLTAAAQWLARELGHDMSGAIVALPGARAGRRLAEHLARALGPAWTPPRIVTEGRLTDELLILDRPAAPRLVRTLAWERALRELPPATLRPLLARPPARSDASGWTRVAEEVRGLFGELAAQALDFHRVAAETSRIAGSGEAARFSVLARAQERVTELLDAAGLADPHLLRLAALEKGAVRADVDVILVGVVETHALLARTLERVAGRVTALVLAPPEEAGQFDELGCLVTEAWATSDVALPLDRWKVVDGPADQARAVMEALAGLEGRFAAEDVTLGIADAEVTPFLARRLAEHGVIARDAAGEDLARTPPARLLAAVADFLATRSFRAYQALARHPDLEACWLGDPRLARHDALELLDEHLAEHLPGVVDGAWLGAGPRHDALLALHASLRGVLGELLDEDARPLSAWTGPIRALLVRCYGGRELDRQSGGGSERALAAGLSAVGDVLAELDAVPPSLAQEVTAAQAVQRLVKLLAEKALPPAPEDGRPTIELLGWLELPLDDAPALVVTGFQEGKVPASVSSDAWLPNDLRRRVGLEDDRRRLARDVFAATLLLDSRAEVCFVTGRRSAKGDPLRPSRIAFHAPQEEIPARVRHALSAAGARPATPEPETRGLVRALPRREGAVPRERYSVTSFRAYLESPYLFYLRHVLRVETFAHDGRELDPMGFGQLAHGALEVLAREEQLARSTDEARLAGALESELRRLARERFGAAPLPAVELQVDQLAWRLRHFARRQAERARAGWRVACAEWVPPSPVRIDVDGVPIELTGRVDRVDVHPDGRWAVLDYKTSETGLRNRAEKAHRKQDEWRDLQLPLYALLVTGLGAELGRDGVPELGYAVVGRDEANIDFDVVTWSPEILESALDAARDVVRAVRRGDFFEVGRARPYEPVIAALLGQGLLAGGEPDGEDENGAEEGA